MARLQAVVLCGGLGTRLRGTVPDLPKALAPVAGQPFLDYLLTDLAAAGISDVVLCTGHGSEAIEAEYGGDAHRGMSITYSIEREPLGTAGAVKHAEREIHSNPFLLLNGDSLLEIDMEQLVVSHNACGAIATLALARVSHPERYGSVVLDANGEIREFSEKASAESVASGGGNRLINAGVYALDRSILQEIPAAPRAVSFESEILPSLIGRGLFGFVCEGFFIDIGVPEDYERAQTEIPRRSNCACSHTR
jgi:NDP-sugar pyrophosphorylase family protein